MRAVPFNVSPGKSNVAGDFHRPYEGSEILTFHHPSGDTPSVTPVGRASSLREGAGIWCVPFNVPPGKRNVAGDFHRPYETQSVLHFTIQLPTVFDAEAIPGEALTYGNQLKA